MGIRFTCPNGHKLHVKEFLAGKRGVCPNCGEKFVIPAADLAPPEAPSVSPALPVETPSVVIPVIKSTADRGPSIPPTSASETIAPPIVALASSDIVAIDALPVLADGPAAPVASSTAILLRRRQRRRTQIIIAIWLFVAAVVLAIVLVWVLVRNSEPEAVAAATPVGVLDDLRQGGRQL